MALLFVAGSSGGALAPVAGQPGQYELAMTGVEPSLTWFSDRPARRAGRESVAEFLDKWAGFGFAHDPPNAALTVHSSADPNDSGTKVVELSTPVYDAAAATLSFHARELADGPRERLEFVKDELAHPFPDSFKSVDLFIDDANVPAAPNATGGLDATSAQPVLYVTFSGEASKGVTHPIETVMGFPAGGGDPIEVLPFAQNLRELRGMALNDDGTLYVAVSYTDDTFVERYGPPRADGTRASLGHYATHADNPGLWHPYGVTFDGAGDLLVSSQDTCLVTRFTGTAKGAPAPLPSWLQDTRQPFAGGTFVAQGTTPPPQCSTNRTLVDRGVQWPRGIAAGNGMVYVADNPAGVVREYDIATGEPKGELSPWADPTNPFKPAPAPVGVYLSGTTLFVSSEATNDVWAFDTATGKGSEIVATKATASPAWKLPKGVSDIELDAPSGLTCGTDGALYVNSRQGRQILRYDLAAHSASVFADKLTDEPEQILAVAASPPTCTVRG